MAGKVKALPKVLVGSESDVWHSGPAMVFWPCEGVLGPELCRVKVGRQSQDVKVKAWS